MTSDQVTEVFKWQSYKLYLSVSLHPIKVQILYAFYRHDFHALGFYEWEMFSVSGLWKKHTLMLAFKLFFSLRICKIFQICIVIMAFERLHFDISFSDLGSTSRSHWHQKDKTEEKRVNFNSVVVFSLCLSKFCLIKFKLCAVLDVNEVCIVYTHKKSDYHFMIRIHAHEKD